MKFLSFSRFILISIFPLLAFLVILNFTAFDESFYESKFSEYNVAESVKEPLSLHQQVIGFIKGHSPELPDSFNKREKEHLFDVRNLVSVLSIVLYFLIAVFILLLIASGMALKVSGKITNFIGKIMVFGGFLTVALALVLFVLISSDFSSTFESFHRLFFEPGSYLFDPSSESIVRLYPEQIFMDIGLRISRWVLISSALFIVAGFYMASKPKRK